MVFYFPPVYSTSNSCYIWLVIRNSIQVVRQIKHTSEWFFSQNNVNSNPKLTLLIQREILPCITLRDIIDLLTYMQLLVLWPLEINHFNSKHLNSIEPKLNLEFPLVLPVSTVFSSVASFVDLTDAIPTSPHSHCARPPYLHSTPATLPAVPLPPQSSTGQHLCHAHQINSYSLKFFKCFPIVITHAYLSGISYNGILSLP